MIKNYTTPRDVTQAAALRASFDAAAEQLGSVLDVEQRPGADHLAAFASQLMTPPRRPARRLLLPGGGLLPQP